MTIIDCHSEVKNQESISRLFNDPLAALISQYEGNKQLHFVPFIHPVLDCPDYLHELVSEYNPVAFKIHGVSHGITPDMLNYDSIKALQQIDIPLIVHTDFSLDSNSVKGYIKSQNSSLKWAKFFIQNGIKGYLTHGARLDKETIKLINEYDNLTLGIGPDLLLSSYPSGLKDLNQFTDQNMLTILRNNVELEKLLFDADYSWNFTGREKLQDYEMIDRVNTVFSEMERKKVLKRNAIRFFELEKR